MKIIYQLLLFILLAAVAAGCNNDIFIDESDMPEDQSVTIEGDGGEAVLRIPSKGLKLFILDLMSESEKYCHYYDAAGNIIDANAPASEVHRIVFETLFTKLELTRNGSELKVKSICSALRYDADWTVRLEYSFGVRFLHVKVLPGQPIQLIDVVYQDDMEVSDGAKVTTVREGFNNNSPLPQTITMRPYLNELASILVEPKQRNSWIIGERFNMPVPVYDNGEWKFLTKNGIIPGNNFTYEGPDRMTKVDLTIPEYSNVKIYTDVTYVGAKVTGLMYFRNEVLDINFYDDITVTSYYPVKYDFRIEDAK